MYFVMSCSDKITFAYFTRAMCFACATRFTGTTCFMRATPFAGSMRFTPAMRFTGATVRLSQVKLGC